MTRPQPNQYEDTELRRLYSCIMHDKYDGVDREDMFIKEAGLVIEQEATRRCEVLLDRLQMRINAKTLIKDNDTAQYLSDFIYIQRQSLNNKEDV